MLGFEPRLTGELKLLINISCQSTRASCAAHECSVHMEMAVGGDGHLIFIHLRSLIPFIGPSCSCMGPVTKDCSESSPRTLLLEIILGNVFFCVVLVKMAGEANTALASPCDHIKITTKLQNSHA